MDPAWYGIFLSGLVAHDAVLGGFCCQVSLFVVLLLISPVDPTCPCYCQLNDIHQLCCWTSQNPVVNTICGVGERDLQQLAGCW